MSSFWSAWIIILTVANIIGAVWLLWATSRSRPGDQPVAGETTGHTWDGDLKEYNNPLPRWWLWLFYLTVVFSIIYLILFPGLGNFAGVTGWSQVGRYEQEVAAAEEKYGPFFARFADMDLAAIAADEDAMAAAANIFGNRCAQCHGSDGRGGKGFPNLADGAWQWGGDAGSVITSIAQGRAGVMPPMAESIGGDAGVANMVDYVRSLSGLDHDADKAAQAQPMFAVCGACHGMDGTGNPALGAPSLTDTAWLHGSDPGAIRETIVLGRNNQMPAQEPDLGKDKVRVMAAYVLRLSGQAGR
jgi:cytochrome c oxidase cbb3-type subunit 3